MLQNVLIRTLPSVTLRTIKKLPDQPGIYIVTSFTTVLYVGQAESLLERWTGTGNRKHHKLDTIRKTYKGVRIYFEVVPEEELNYHENKHYDNLQPILNKRRPPRATVIPHQKPYRKKKVNAPVKKKFHQKSSENDVLNLVMCIVIVLIIYAMVN